MATKNDSARSGKTQTLDEVLQQLGYFRLEDEKPKNVKEALELVQLLLSTRSQRVLMIEHWDWLVVLQCLQDHHLFTIHPQQPPLTEFVNWLHTNHVQQRMAQASVRTMSYANNQIRGARYPWDEVKWNRHVIERWKELYKTLDSILYDVTNGME